MQWNDFHNSKRILKKENNTFQNSNKILNTQNSPNNLMKELENLFFIIQTYYKAIICKKCVVLAKTNINQNDSVEIPEKKKLWSDDFEKCLKSSVGMSLQQILLENLTSPCI